MTLDPHPMLVVALAAAATWLMTQAGLAKNALELRRKRYTCPACGRHDRCTCGT
jgi:hypothetical protein